MKNNIDIKWFRNYLIENNCCFDEIMGGTETWVRKDNKDIFAQFNGSKNIIEESTAKEVIRKLRLSITDFARECTYLD